MKYLLIVLLLLVVVKTQYNESLGRFLGKLTVASYCGQKQINQWSCPVCKNVSDMKYVHVFKNRTNDTCGYIAVNDAEDAVVLVLRGTLPWDLKNWISDFNFLKRKYALCDNGCEVHRGFMEDYAEISQQIKRLVKKYTSSYNKKKLYVTGHSLGAALATLTVADLIYSGFHVDQYYSLGSPRVGDKKFQQWFNRVWGNRFKARITHHKDPFTHLPFQLWGFSHLTTQIFYNKDFSSFKICDDSQHQDKTCSNQYDLDLGVNDHAIYFNINYLQQMLICQ